MYMHDGVLLDREARVHHAERLEDLSPQAPKGVRRCFHLLLYIIVVFVVMLCMVVVTMIIIILLYDYYYYCFFL